MKKQWFFYTNWLIQIVLILGSFLIYKTFHNQFLMFFTNYSGFFAALVSKYLRMIYYIIQFFIFVTIIIKKPLKDKCLNALTIISLPLLGWVSIFNAVFILYMYKKTAK